MFQKVMKKIKILGKKIRYNQLKKMTKRMIKLKRMKRKKRMKRTKRTKRIKRIKTTIITKIMIKKNRMKMT